MHQEADECSNIYTHPPLLFSAHPTSAGLKPNPVLPKKAGAKGRRVPRNDYLCN